MKTFIRLTLLLAACLAAVSCSTKQEITVFGTPGTEILEPDYTKIGSIQSNGQLKFKLTIDLPKYFPFLLSHNPGAEEYVPFALDYKYKNYSTINSVCAYSCLSVIGIPIAILTVPFTDFNTTGYNNFKYLSHQQTNDGIVFTAYDNTGEMRAVGSSTGMKNEEAPTAASQGTYSKARSRTSKATRTLDDNGKSAAGTYRGTGKLRRGNAIVETYKNMALTVERIDKNTVRVTVKDDYGEPFFSQADRYRIKKGRGRSLDLTLDGIPSATIRIDGNGKMSYNHPKVNIDGDIYTLEISASKQ